MQTVSSASTYMITGLGKEDGCGDAHRLPGNAKIDWKETMKLVRASAYEQPFMMEVSSRKGKTAHIT